MIRIGVVNIDTSHPKSFGKYLEKNNRACFAGVYNDGFREEIEVNAFMKRFGVERLFSTVEELADFTDIGFVQGIDWDKHLEHAIPFIKRGKPVFIDKPIVGCISDCNRIEQLVKNGAVILGSSSLRYAEEIASFKALAKETTGKILHIYGTAGNDEFFYAIHIVEAICQLAGAAPLSSRFVGRAKEAKTIVECFFVEFENGATATYTTCQGVGQPFEIVITTEKSTYQFKVDTTRIYAVLLDTICDYMETKINRLAPIKNIADSVRIMIAGRVSRDMGGIAVKINDLAENQGYSGTEFIDEYRQQRPKKIYMEP